MIRLSDIKYRSLFRLNHLPRRKLAGELRRASLLVIGTALAAFGFVLFQVPYNMAAGGIGGIGLIINSFTGWPIGTLFFLLNIPLMALGFRHLGRWPFVFRTAIAAGLFAIFTDLFTLWFPEILDPFPPADDMLLSAVYGGILGGIGGGIVYRSGSTMGGTGIIGRWIQFRTGQPLSQIYIYTDGAILLAMGLVFGWTVTLYGLLILFINGLASDYIMEGPSSTRVVTIVTNHPDKIAKALMGALDRGVSYWEVTGGYSNEKHFMVTCTVSRPQVAQVKSLVASVDPEAFVTIAVGHQAFGSGFTPIQKTK